MDFLGIGNIAEDAVVGLITLFNEFFARVVALFASVLNWTFSIQDITRIDVIQFAWSVSRDFANMFFILLLLIIAFATILRIEPYGIKKLLPKVLIVALLINFSLVGTGIIIDIGSTLGFFFVSGGSAEVDDLGANIAAAIGIQNLNNYETTGNAGISDRDVSGEIGNALFNLMLTVIVSFLFIAMAGLMVVRLVALWILVMFVPLALVAWIVPAGQKYWSKWWDKFFAWAFFPAIFGIFIYFGLIIGNAFRADVFTELGAGDPGEGGRFSLVVQDFLQLIVVVMILFAGLTQAKSAGLEGAGLAVKWGNKAKDFALNQTKSGAKFAGKTAVKAAPEPLRRKVREGLEKMPIAGRAIGGPGARHKEFVKRIKEQEKEMKDMRPQDLRAIADQSVATEEGRARRAAAIKQLAEKGKLEERDKKHFGDFLTAGGDAKAVLQNMPTWILDEKIQGQLAKHPATATDWAPIVGMASGSAGRVELAKRAFRNKMLPQKPKEFSKTSKAAINIYDDEISGRELQVRREILQMYVKEFQEGGRFHANALSALANDNPQAYEVLARRLNEKYIYDTLQDGVKKFLKSGPVAAFDTSTPAAPPAEEKTT